MERDILADVNHPFIVKLHYGTLLLFFFNSLLMCSLDFGRHVIIKESKLPLRLLKYIAPLIERNHLKLLSIWGGKLDLFYAKLS